MGVAFWPRIKTDYFDLQLLEPDQESINKMWTRVGGGESFDNITLQPSVNAEGAGHWHGNIINGEMS